MSGLTLANVSRDYGSFSAISDVSLAIESGEFAVFVGPSGCGKSTLLRLIAGLDPVTDGTITIGDVDVTNRQAGQRPVAMVFQSYALYPHMSVFDNIAFPLKMERRRKADIRQEVEKAAASVQLSTRLSDKPGKLSGGQRQRVAIARAIVRKPDIFLMDEPLSNLDAALRLEMRAELISLHRRLGSTMIYVTHDQLEAMTMADRIVVLRDGRVEQVGRPMDIYKAPANTFVARFIGSPPMNMLALEILDASDDVVEASAAGIVSMSLKVRPGTFVTGAKATLGIRPEAIALKAPEEPAILFTVTPQTIERLGAHMIVHADFLGNTLTCLFNGDPAIARDKPLDVFVPIRELHIFDESGIACTRFD